MLYILKCLGRIKQQGVNILTSRAEILDSFSITIKNTEREMKHFFLHSNCNTLVVSLSLI